MEWEGTRITPCLASPSQNPRSGTALSSGTRQGLEAKPPKCRLAPPHTVKRTSQESGGELCEIFKCWSFVNEICKLLQFTPYRASPLDPTGARRTLWAIYSPQLKIPEHTPDCTVASCRYKAKWFVPQSQIAFSTGEQWLICALMFYTVNLLLA